MHAYSEGERKGGCEESINKKKERKKGEKSEKFFQIHASIYKHFIYIHTP